MWAHRCNGRHGERGVALITALLIVAILTAILGRLALSNQLWIRQAENAASQQQLDQAARAAERWLALILEREDEAYDGATDIWALALPQVPVGQGRIHVRIEDLQARFNLNNLVNDAGEADPLNAERFRRLLAILGLDPGITDAVIDWIDPDRLPGGTRGAEDDYYASLDPAYLPANQPMSRTAELRRVRGVDAATWQRLEPFVAALPQVTDVNVNTALPEVLAAVMTDWGSPTIAMSEARRWLGQIRGKPATDVETFGALALGGPDRLIPPGLSINTQYFLAHLQLSFGNSEQRLAAAFYRRDGRAVAYRHQREF